MTARTPTTACLTDDDLALLIEGTPDERFRSSVEDHVAGCASCRELVGLPAGPGANPELQLLLGRYAGHFQAALATATETLPAAPA